VTGGKIVDRYQSLMNADVRIPAFIEALTGISNAMLRQAPPAAEVMGALAEFVGDMPLVAHNASFDSKFLDAEWLRIKQRRRQEFACSLLLARRIYPAAPITSWERLSGIWACPRRCAITARWPTRK
jgi:DNA polymerase-3 subunit epsilon